MTNGDKIRSMSNAEIAELIDKFNFYEQVCSLCPIKGCDWNNNNCVQGIIAWLNSEAEDKEND